MEYQNVIHPEEEYRAFGKMLTDSSPLIEEGIEDQDVIDAYNKIKESDPSITLDALQQQVPGIAKQILAGFQEKGFDLAGGSMPQESNVPEKSNKLDALRSMGRN